MSSFKETLINAITITPEQEAMVAKILADKLTPEEIKIVVEHFEKKGRVSTTNAILNTAFKRIVQK